MMDITYTCNSFGQSTDVNKSLALADQIVDALANLSCNRYTVGYTNNSRLRE